jgi:lysophospholipase L1-like esterase
VAFDSIEIEAVRQPHGGTIEVRLDGALESTFDLSAAAVEPIVFRLRPKKQPVGKFRQLEIKTTGDGPVVLSSVAINNSRSGVTLSAVGFPGATISVLNKLAPDLFADDLRRIDPQIVILAFGTNEASNDKLSPEGYGSTYQGVIDKIKAALPAASVVILGPPDGEEHAPSCKTGTVEAVCRSATSDLPSETAAQPANAGEADCSWHQLPKLTEVRDAQRDIASRGSYAYWNWASIMPEQCGAQHWVTASPPLMTPDHIHFTHDGYAKSADAFLPTLLPLVEKYGAGGKAASSD